VIGIAWLEAGIWGVFWGVGPGLGLNRKPSVRFVAHTRMGRGLHHIQMWTFKFQHQTNHVDDNVTAQCRDGIAKPLDMKMFFPYDVRIC
jgi:hypothetical protein